MQWDFIGSSLKHSFYIIAPIATAVKNIARDWGELMETVAFATVLRNIP